MTSVGIRELRDRLAHCLREVERTGDPQAPITIVTCNARIREHAALLGLRVA